MPVYFSVDFESRGPSYSCHGVNAVGIVVFNEDGIELEKYESGIHQPDRVFDADTKKFFWDKNPEALKWTEDHTQHAKNVVADIIRLMNKYNHSHGKVVWLAWPAAYDWALLVQLFDEKDFPYALPFKATCIRSMFDAYCIANNLDADRKFELLGLKNENPHLPASDARTQGQAYFELVRRLRGKRVRKDSD